MFRIKKWCFTGLFIAISFAIVGKGKIEKEGNKTKSNAVDISNLYKYRTFESIDNFPEKKLYTELDSKLVEFDEKYLSRFEQKGIQENQMIERALYAFDELKKSGNYIDKLENLSKIKAPIGLQKNFGNHMIEIAVTALIEENGAIYANIYLKIQMEKNDIMLGAEGIVLKGTKIDNNTKLTLLEDYAIKMPGEKGLLIFKAGKLTSKGAAEGGSYGIIDCDGLNELNIEMDYEFSRKIIIPVDKNTLKPIDDNKRVKISFDANILNFNDILAEVSIPKFQIPGNSGFVFEVKKAVFDFSDLKNSKSIKFPDDYNQIFVGGSKESWKGFFLKEFNLTFPPEFEKKGDNKRIQVFGKNILIDNYGVSGSLEGKNILSIKDGSADGWQFSIQQFHIGFTLSKLTLLNFDGGLVLPTSGKAKSDDDKNKILRYKASYNAQDDEYILGVSLGNDMDFDFASAKLYLESNSYIELKVIKEKFRPKVALFGKLNIKTKSNDTDIEFEGVVFQNLVLQTQKPYIKVDYIGYKGSVGLAGFPATIGNISMTCPESICKIGFDVNINLSEGVFAAGTRVEVVSSIEDIDGSQEWKYKTTTISKISLAGQVSSVITISGTLSFFENDPLYGKGIYGDVTMDIKGIGIVKSQAMFGKTDFRYWFINAEITFVTPLVMGAIEIPTLGGGLSYGMSRKSSSLKSNIIPSTVQYSPDKNTGLGFRAMIYYSFPKSPETLNGRAEIEFSFNTNWGLNYIAVYGSAHMMTPVTSDFGNLGENLSTLSTTKSPSSSGNLSIDEEGLIRFAKANGEAPSSIGIDGYLALKMDFENSSFHGEIEVYFNTTGDFLKGVGERGKVGSCVIHSAKDAWYIYVGTPNDRIGMKFGMGSLSLTIDAYLMVGSKILGSPPPPAIINDILNLKPGELDYMGDLNSLGTGKGFAFGASLNVNTDEKTFGIIYFNLNAGLGFDIMLKDYGGTRCKGSSGPIGINGWYANGQAYAYFKGSVGIIAKLFFTTKRIPIVDLGAALVVQAKLPNPVWFRGTAGVKYNVLGGLISGSSKFTVELGQQCESIGGSPLGGAEIISSIDPINNTNNFNVMKSPQIAFNLPIDQKFRMEDENGSPTSYKIKLVSIDFKKDNTDLVYEQKFNKDKKSVNLVTSEVLPPKSNLSIDVKVALQVFKNNKWIDYKDNGKSVEEKKLVTFTTGDAPDNIPLDNISFMYPLIDQDFLYTSESKIGYVKLNKGQEYLFKDPNFTNFLTLQENKYGKVIAETSEIGYQSNDKLVTFKLPELDNDKTYLITLKRKPKGIASNNSTKINKTKAQSKNADDNVSINTTVSESSTNETDILILEIPFKTSKYKFLSDKIHAKKLSKGQIFIVTSDIHILEADVQNTEPFGSVELLGSVYSGNKPLIKVTASLTDDYYQNMIYPLIYSDKGMAKKVFESNYKSEITNSIYISSWYDNYYKNNTGNNYNNVNTRMPHVYNLVSKYKEHYKKLNNHVLNISGDKSKYKKLIEEAFPSITGGNYPVSYQYVLPGNKKGSISAFNFVNPS